MTSRQLSVKVALVTATVSALTLAPLAANAAWRTDGAGSARAAAGSLLPATGAATSVSGQSVTVSWTSPANPSGTLYEVRRATALVCSQAASPCREDNVPAGSHSYTVTPVLGTAPWSAVAVGASATVQATVTAPTVTVGSMPANGVTYGTNDGNSGGVNKTIWANSSLTGSVSSNATSLIVTMRNTATDRFATVQTVSTGTNRFTSETAVPLTASITGTSWTVAWDNNQFPPANGTTGLELVVTASNSAGSATVTRTFSFHR